MTLEGNMRRQGQHLGVEERELLQERFLELFEELGLSAEAAKRTPVAHSTVVWWKHHDDAFKARWLEARRVADERLRDELERARQDGLREEEWERAWVLNPETGKKEQTGELVLVRRAMKQDARVLLGAAQARLEEYRPVQKVELSGPNGGPLAMVEPAEARGMLRLIEGARELGLLPSGEVIEGETN